MTPPTPTIRLKAGESPPEGAIETATPGLWSVGAEVDTAAIRAGVRDGRWLPQDEASARVVGLLGLAPGERVLELCAGRGMKSSQLAETVGPSGSLVSADRSAAKLADARRLVERWAPGTRHDVLAVDAGAALPLRPDVRFDGILIDAPCSGLGVIRRRPETLWTRRPEDVTELAALQARILAEARRWVRPGGRIVYAVCTTTPEETTERVAGFAVSDSFLTRTEVDGCDGFFAARLECP